MPVVGGRAVFGTAFSLLLTLLPASIDSVPWWDGIDGIKVLSPGDAGAQATVDAIASTQLNGQFNTKR